MIVCEAAFFKTIQKPPEVAAPEASLMHEIIFLYTGEKAIEDFSFKQISH